MVRTHSALRNFGYVLNHYGDFADSGSLMDALRILALAEFFMLFVDFPTYLITLLVYVTPWRCYKIHGEMREHFKLDFADENNYIHGKWREKVGPVIDGGWPAGLIAVGCGLKSQSIGCLGRTGSGARQNWMTRNFVRNVASDIKSRVGQGAVWCFF